MSQMLSTELQRDEAEFLAPVGAFDRETVGQQINEVLNRVADGATVNEAVQAVGIKKTTLYYWLLRNKKLEPMWRIARRLQAQSLFDRAMTAVGRLETEEWAKDDTNQVRALDSAARWLLFAAARLNPSDFGEQQAKNPPVVVEIVTSLGVGLGVSTGPGPSTYTLEVRPPVTDIEGSALSAGSASSPAMGQTPVAGSLASGSNVLTSPDMGMSAGQARRRGREFRRQTAEGEGSGNGQGNAESE